MPQVEVEELFARLTAIFEDAAALAARGQQKGLSKDTLAAMLDEVAAVHLDAGHLIQAIATQTRK